MPYNEWEEGDQLPDEKNVPAEVKNWKDYATLALIHDIDLEGRRKYQKEELRTYFQRLEKDAVARGQELLGRE
jgi:hypothetical protein